MKKLARDNPILGLDGRLEFSEVGHRYVDVVNDRRVPLSVTGLLRRFFPSDFDGPKIINEKFADWRDNSSSRYFKLIRHLASNGERESGIKRKINEMWTQNGANARTRGTAMHLALELSVNGEPQVEDTEDFSPVVDAWTREYTRRGWRPFRTEIVMPLVDKHDQVVLAGTADALFLDENDDIVLVDYKRLGVDKQLTREAKPWDKNACGRMAAYLNTSYVQYSTQLMVYAKMLKPHLPDGQQVSGCYLVQAHEELPDVTVVKAGEGLDGLEDAVADVLRELCE